MRCAALGFVLPFAIAANPPAFTYTVPANTTVSAMAVDSAGDTYLTGSTTSTSFPATLGALQTQFSGGICAALGAPGGGVINFPCSDAFVVKLDSSRNVVYATYFGGDGSQTVASAICLDAAGNVYIGGGTGQNIQNLPYTFLITPGAAFTNPSASYAFIAKLNASGDQIIYSTYLPINPYASGGAPPLAMAIDQAGNAYFAATDQGVVPFPVTPGAFQSSAPQYPGSGVVAKLNAAGSALLYATYLSGSDLDQMQSIAVDSSGNAYIAGSTESPDFPVTPGAFETEFPGGVPGFVAKLNPSGTALVYSTFLDWDTAGVRIKVDSQGGAHVLAQASSVVSNGAYISRLSPDGSALIYSVFVPSTTGLDLDSTGNAFVAGTVSSAILSATSGSFQPGFAGGSSDAYAAKITPDGQLSAATYLGGSQADSAALIAIAPDGSVRIAGTTESPDFPGISSAPAGFVISILPWLTIANAASQAIGPVAPGEIVTLRGYDLGPQTAVTAPSSEPQTYLGGTQVSFNTILAPLFSVQAQSITAQVPWEALGSANVSAYVLGNGANDMSSATVAAASAAPGIFAIANPGGTQNSPANPANPGDVISIYGTGGGAANPAGVTGAQWPASALSTLTGAVSITIGSVNATVLYAGSAPTLESGYFQINAIIPATAPPGSASVVLTIAGASSAAFTISVN